MEEIFEFIIEVVFEIFAEAIEAAATSKRIPLVIRIVIMLLISAFCLGLAIVGIYGIIMSKETIANILFGIVGTVGLLLFTLFQFKWWKAIKAK
ncbi:MAG: hypothetical protein IJX24_01320 [Oscillospiraceae bacterium]|nr:hypothetical protein [Oscillospiraceae bacterium]